ncbi:MAG: hypothetical protein JOZ58_01240 [Acetobacteraceae bacterium]|nr:hypothetical protein [Acetobacteraceae bacterium]
MVRVVSLLGLLIAALGGMLFAEYRSFDAKQDTLPEVALAQPTTASAIAPSHSESHVEQWVATILARPVFSPLRRPPASAGAKGNGPPELGRLTGVLIANSEKRAIFASENGKPVVAEEGARIGAYEVRSIEPGQVTVLGPEGIRVLEPVYDPKARQAARPAGPMQLAPTPAQPAAPPRPPAEKPADQRVAR